MSSSGIENRNLHPSDRRPVGGGSEGKASLAVFVLIDALGWKYLQGRRFLDDILPYRRPLRTVLGFSSGAIPTMLTGVPPVEHGHWNLFYYDPQNSPFKWVSHLNWIPQGLLDSRVGRRLFKEIGKRFLGLGPLFDCAVKPQLLPFFNWVEKKNIYDRQGICGAKSIFDRLAERGVPYRVYTYHEASDAEILKRAERDIEFGEAAFFFVYLCEMDMFLHMHCKEPQEIDRRLAWYESALRKLFGAALRRDPKATFTITSDHGMTPVEKQYDLIAEFETIDLHMPDDYLAVYDSTMARFWFFNEHARAVVRGVLEKVTCGHVLSEAEMRRFGVLFTDHRYGEIIFLLDPGWLFARSDFNGTAWFPAGMHGYDPEDGYSDAIFLSNQQPPLEVDTIRDVYDCMWKAAPEGR